MSTSRDLTLNLRGNDESASSTLDVVAEKANALGETLAQQLGVPLALSGIGTVLAGIVSIGTAYEDSLNTFQPVSGATEAQMAQVSATAKQLGADLTLPATSAAGAAEAMTELAKGGLSVQQAMDAARGTLQLATAAQVDEAEAAQITAAALNTFGLEGDRAVQVSDLLAGASVAASGEITDMSAALTQAGTVANAAGLSVADTTAAISLLAKNGILGSDAGTSLKTMLMKLQGPSKEAAKELQALGINVYDANGVMLPFRDLVGTFSEKMSGLTQEQRDQANATIFGSDATRAALTVLEGGVDTYDAMHASVTEAGVAARVAEANSKGLSGAWRGLQSTAETLAVEVYQQLAPGLAELLGHFGRLVAAVAPVVLAFAGVLGVGIELVAWVASHKEGVIALATIYLASLGPALLITINRFTSMIVLGVIDFLVGVAARAESAAVAMRALSLATAAATIGLGLAVYALVDIVQDFTSAAEDAEDATAKLFKAKYEPNSRAAISATTRALEEQKRAAKEAADGILRGSRAGGLSDWFRFRKQAEASTEALGELDDRSASLTRALDGLSRYTGYSEQKLLQLATAAGVDLADGTGKASAAVLALDSKQRAAVPGAAMLAEATETLGDEAASAEDQVKALKNGLFVLFGVPLDLSQTTDAYKASFDALAESAKKNGTSLDGNTEKGRSNRDAMRGIVQAAQDLVLSQEQAGKSTDEQRRTMIKAREELIRKGVAAGFTKDQISAMTREMGFIPENIKTAFTTPGLPAATKAAEALDLAVRNIPTKKNITITARLVTIGQMLKDGNLGRGEAAAATKEALKGRASGGPVSPGESYLVGEEGPELIVPRGPGTVLTADATAALRANGSDRALAPSGTSGRAGSPLDGGVTVPVVLKVDGRVLAQTTVRHTREELVGMQDRGTDLGFST